MENLDSCIVFKVCKSISFAYNSGKTRFSHSLSFHRCCMWFVDFVLFNFIILFSSPPHLWVIYLTCEINLFLQTHSLVKHSHCTLQIIQLHFTYLIKYVDDIECRTFFDLNYKLLSKDSKKDFCSICFLLVSLISMVITNRHIIPICIKNMFKHHNFNRQKFFCTLQ